MHLQYPEFQCPDRYRYSLDRESTLSRSFLAVAHKKTPLLSTLLQQLLSFIYTEIWVKPTGTQVHYECYNMFALTLTVPVMTIDALQQFETG